jgi:hypothetical protein
MPLPKCVTCHLAKCTTTGPDHPDKVRFYHICLDDIAQVLCQFRDLESKEFQALTDFQEWQRIYEMDI